MLKSKKQELVIQPLLELTTFLYPLNLSYLRLDQLNTQNLFYNSIFLMKFLVNNFLGVLYSIIEIFIHL